MTPIRDDAEYWDALAERVAAIAAREQKPSGFDWLARSRADWVAASLLIAAVLMLTMLPAEKSSAAVFRAEWTEVLAPSDDVGRAIVSRDRPPAIGALLIGGPGGVR